MSSRRRTFVLQAVGVAVVIGVIFFAFLRPTDVDDLSGIDVPGDNGSTFGIPGEGDETKKGPRSDRSKGNRASDRPDPGEAESFGEAGSPGGAASRLGGDPLVPPVGDDPVGDQYTSTTTALMNRVRAQVNP
jgi:hypothetical protein